MSPLILTIICAVLLGAVALAGVLILVRSHWFAGWLKGTAGLGLLLAAVAGGLYLFDLASYRALEREKLIATVSFEQLDDSYYKAMISVPDQDTRYFNIHGNLWQLDVRLITWDQKLAVIGLFPSYRLDRLSGRYEDVEEELNAPRSVFQLSDSSVVDIWSTLKGFQHMGFADASYGSATYMPMTHGAIYAVNLTNKGLLARPLNDPARQALEYWK